MKVIAYETPIGPVKQLYFAKRYNVIGNCVGSMLAHRLCGLSRKVAAIASSLSYAPAVSN